MDCGEQDEVSMSETISELSQYSHQKGKADHAYCVRNSGT